MKNASSVLSNNRNQVHCSHCNFFPICIAFQRKFVHYRKIGVNTSLKLGNIKELLLEPLILLLINDSCLPRDIQFFEICIIYSLNIHGSSCTWIWILLAKSVYSDCPYALGVTVSPFHRQKEKNITVSQQ